MRLKAMSFHVLQDLSTIKEVLIGERGETGKREVKRADHDPNKSHRRCRRRCLGKMMRLGMKA